MFLEVEVQKPDGSPRVVLFNPEAVVAIEHAHSAEDPLLATRSDLTSLQLLGGGSLTVPGDPRSWRTKIESASVESELPSGPENALAAGGQGIVNMINSTYEVLAKAGKTPKAVEVTDSMIKLIFHWAKLRRLDEVANMGDWSDLAMIVRFKIGPIKVQLLRSAKSGWEF